MSLKEFLKIESSALNPERHILLCCMVFCFVLNQQIAFRIPETLNPKLRSPQTPNGKLFQAANPFPKPQLVVNSVCLVP